MTLAGFAPDGSTGPKVVRSTSLVSYDSKSASSESGLSAKLPYELDAEELFSRTKRVASLVSLEAVRNDTKWLASKAPPDPSGVVAYLMLFGFSAFAAQQWTKVNGFPLPQLDVRVVEHAEISDHTWYTIDCSLRTEGIEDALEWQTARRLCHMRELWYVHVKREIGQKYNRHFSGAHFANHGGIAGTTARLNAWCKALATCVNAGAASPYVVALTLRHLDAPHLLAMESRLHAADVGIDPAMAAALQGTPCDIKSAALPIINAREAAEVDLPRAAAPIISVEEGMNLPLSHNSLPLAPTQIGVGLGFSEEVEAEAPATVDPWDISLDMGIQDENSAPCGEGGMAVPLRTSQTESWALDSLQEDVVTFHDADLDPFGDMPCCEEGGNMSVPSRDYANDHGQFMIEDMVDFGLPSLEEESTTFTQDLFFDATCLPSLDSGFPAMRNMTPGMTGMVREDHSRINDLQKSATVAARYAEVMGPVASREERAAVEAAPYRRGAPSMEMGRLDDIG